MTLDTATEYRREAASRLSTQVERTCMVLLQSELDIAFGFLRLAEVETESGNAAHADELIAKASSSYKEVLDGLANVPLEFEEERQSLREGVRMLQDAIRAVARRRQQDLALH
jgi:hypothetical protein